MVWQEVLSTQTVNTKWGLPPTHHLFLNSRQPKGHGLLSGNLLHHVFGESTHDLLTEWPKFLPPARGPPVLGHMHLDSLPRVFYGVWCTSMSGPNLPGSCRLAWWSGAGLWPGFSHRFGTTLVTTFAAWPWGTHSWGGRLAWSVNLLISGIS